jgi:alpha-glucuronidase
MIDEERFEHVKSLLQVQANEARWWRDACITYFQQFSHLPVPGNLVKPMHTLDEYQRQKFFYVPGI